MSTHTPGKQSATRFKPNDFFYLQTQTGWQRTLQSFANWCAPQAGWRVLDAGCGPGIFPALISSMGCQAIGVDLDLNAFLPHPLHTEVAAADAGRLPFPDNSFDLITASNLLFLVPDPEEILREFARLLQQTGQVALLNPSENLSIKSAQELADRRSLDYKSRESLLNWAALAEQHRRWDPAAMEQLFTAAGLKLMETSLKMGPGLARFVRACLLSD